MPVRYTAELIAHVRHRYEETDDTLAKIATDCGISERAVNRMRDREGWIRRGDRPPRGLPPAMCALQDATALLTARSKPTRSPLVPAKAGTQGPNTQASWIPACAGMSGCGSTGADDTPPPPEAETPSAIERIERLVEKELAAEEAVRAQLGPLARPPADAERAARTLATLTQTLHALARLRGGLPPNSGSDDDDDMPRDIDEFRRELARRIDAFVASRTEPGDAGGNPGSAKVDQAR